MRIQRFVRQVRQREVTHQSKLTKVQESYTRMLTEALKARLRRVYDCHGVGMNFMIENLIINHINQKTVETIKKNPADQWCQEEKLLITF